MERFKLYNNFLVTKSKMSEVPIEEIDAVFKRNFHQRRADAEKHAARRSHRNSFLFSSAIHPQSPARISFPIDTFSALFISKALPGIWGTNLSLNCNRLQFPVKSIGYHIIMIANP